MELTQGQAPADDQKPKVLVVIAHPDDEVFVSGTLCMCTDRGFPIKLVCATDGEGGDRALVFRSSGLSLGEIRRRELLLSAAMLGIQEVFFLGQPDVGEPYVPAPGGWDQTRTIDELGGIIERFSPDLILTHGPVGGYGHPAHQLTYRCVAAASEATSFRGSLFSFCGQVPKSFFSWHFDQPADVLVDVRDFLARRVASLSYHQTQLNYFTQPFFPHTLRKWLSALFGFVFLWTEAGRKRIPIGTPSRFFARFPLEGLVLQKQPPDGTAHFFKEHFGHDDCVRIDR